MSDLESSPVQPPPSTEPQPGTSAAVQHPDMERRRLERIARHRESMRILIQSDYLTAYAGEEEAEEIAAELAQENLDHYIGKKPDHVTAMDFFNNKADVARKRVDAATQMAEELPPLLLALQTSFASADLHKARSISEEMRTILQSYKAMESDLKELVADAVAAYYRPSLKDEPATQKMAELDEGFQKAQGVLNFADSVVGELTAVGPQQTPSEISVSSVTATEATKKFAREFPVTAYVTKTFTGDETSALSDYVTWKTSWAHAQQQCKSTCKEADDDALLHLLRSTLGGTAAKLATPALTLEDALATLEEKYDDIVGLVESYLPQPSPPGDTRTSEEKITEALAFATRWTHIRTQLSEHNIDLDTFCGIRIQLAAFGPAAAIKWRQEVKTAMREQPEGAKLGVAYNWTMFCKWLRKLRDDEATKEATDGSSSAGIFAVAEQDTVKTTTAVVISGCLACGTSASHKTAACNKVANLNPEAYLSLCASKAACRRCGQVLWTPSHGKACAMNCKTCGKGHMTTRHRWGQPSAKKRSQSQEPRREPKRVRAEMSREYHAAPSHAPFSKAQLLEVAARQAREEMGGPPPRGAWQGGRARGRGRGRGFRGRGGRGRGSTEPPATKEGENK